MNQSKRTSNHKNGEYCRTKLNIVNKPAIFCNVDAIARLKFTTIGFKNFEGVLICSAALAILMVTNPFGLPRTHSHPPHTHIRVWYLLMHVQMYIVYCTRLWLPEYFSYLHMWCSVRHGRIYRKRNKTNWPWWSSRLVIYSLWLPAVKYINVYDKHIYLWSEYSE